MNSSSAPLRIGDWILHPDRHELEGPAGSRRLQPRLTALLLALAATPGRTVSRDALLETVWTRKVLNDEVLSRSIADLRTALDDDAREPRYIETIPKLGYRLVAAVSPVEEPPERSERRSDRRSDGSRDRNPARLRAPALLLAALAVLAAALLVRNLLPEPEPAPAPLTPDAIAAARPFTSDPGWELTPRFSRDGTLIGYATAQVDDGSALLVLQSRDGTRRRDVGQGDAAWHHCPVFSPDGRDVIWLRATPDGCLLLREPVFGGPRRELAVCAPRVRSCPDWSRDGTTLVFTSLARGSDRASGLAVLDLASGAVTHLTDPALADGPDTEPRFVPGSDAITYTRGTEWGRRLFRVTRDGTPPVALRGERELAYGHTWARDGHAAIYSADTFGQRALLRLTPDGAVTLLGAPGARYPDLADDGSLIFEVARYDANLWRVKAGAEPTQITRSTRYDGHPALSPDGTRLVYQSNRDGLDSLWTVGVDGSDDRRLPLDTATRWVRPNWLPDQSGVLVTRYGPDGTDIWRLRFAAEQPEPLTVLGSGRYDARFDETGAFLYVLRDTPQGRALERVDGELEGQPVEIVAAPVDRYVARNGRLAYHRNDGSDVMLCAADGSDCRASGANLANERRGAWDLANDWLYYAGRKADGSAALLRLPLGATQSGGAPEAVASLVPNTIGPSLSVAADASQAIVAHTDDVEIDLMIVDGRTRPREQPGE